MGHCACSMVEVPIQVEVKPDGKLRAHQMQLRSDLGTKLWRLHILERPCRLIICLTQEVWKTAYLDQWWFMVSFVIYDDFSTSPGMKTVSSLVLVAVWWLELGMAWSKKCQRSYCVRLVMTLVAWRTQTATSLDPQVWIWSNRKPSQSHNLLGGNLRHGTHLQQVTWGLLGWNEAA